MVCLDTDILIAFLRGDKKAVEKIRNYVELNMPILTTPINACELYTGAYRSKNREKNILAVGELLRNIDCLTFDFYSSKLIGFLIETLRKRGKPIGEMDVLIGGLVLAHDETLVTRNIKHFKRIEGLKIEVW